MIVYLAVNRANQKAYVGITTRDFSSRIQEHIWEASVHRYYVPFYNALRKYGVDSFDFAVVEQCDDLEGLRQAERKWVALLGCARPNGYNLATPGGGGVPGPNPPQWTEPIKRAAKIAGLRAAWRRRKDNPEQYRKHNDKVRDKTTEAMRRPDVIARTLAGNWSKRPTSETINIRRKISEGVRRAFTTEDVRSRHHNAILAYHAARKAAGLRGNRFGWRKNTNA